MSDAFDPYLKWLGVPPEEQPANCYRLLGLQLFETSSVAIGRAADERMTYLRQWVPSPQGALAQKLLKEVWAARALLLDPQKKAAYDAKLRSKMPPPAQPAPAEVIPIAVPVMRPRTVRRKRNSVLPMVLRLLGLAAVGVAGVLLWKHFTPPMGTVHVDVAVDDRAGLQLELDGARAGLPDEQEGPYVFRLAPGKHTFLMRRPWYEPFSEEVQVREGETRTVVPRWQHNPRIVIEWPEKDRRGAIIKIDGQPTNGDRVSTTPTEQPLTLPAGDHQLRIERDGFQPFEQKVTLVPASDFKVQPAWEALKRTAQAQGPGDSKPNWAGLAAFQGDQKPVVSSFKGDPNAPADKQSEPALSAQEASKKRIEEKFQIEKASTADEKLKLAKQVAEAAAQPQSDVADSFILHRTAAQLLLQGGDLDGAMKALDKLANAFLIDDLTWRASAIKQFVSGDPDPRRATVAFEQSKNVFDRLLVDRQYAPTKELLEKLLDYCQRSKERQLHKQLLERQVEVNRRAAAYEKYTQAAATLKQKPGDPEASQTVGLWRCLVEGDWKGGLKDLANAAESRVQAVGRAELDGGARTPQDQAKLGNQWYELANKFQDDLRIGMRTRAGYWYEKAYSKLPAGLTKITLEKRLTELGISTTGQTAAASTAPGEKPVVKLPTGPVVTTENGPLDGRVGAIKDQLVAVYGSDAEMQAAVDRGLHWLSQHQYPDGSWSFSHVLAPQCSGKCLNPGELYKCRNTATALALLAMMGAGNSHESGPYAPSVTAGLGYLMAKMKGANLWEQGINYSHAVATTALCEAYAMTRDKRILPAAQQAVLFLCTCQQPNGSWRYDPRAEATAELNCWQVMALKAAHMGQLNVPPQVLKGATRYFEGLKIAAQETTALRAAADDKMATATGLLARIYLGWKKDDLTKGAQQLARLGWAEFDVDFNLYATPVLYNYGGLEWTVWSKALRQSLMRTQATEGHAKGSWAIVDDPNFPKMGRHFSTCVALLNLEVYYRYLPMYRESPPETGEKTSRSKRAVQDPEIQWRPPIATAPRGKKG